MERKMKAIAVSELRANLMKVLKEVAHGTVVEVASRGKVVAKIVPPDHVREHARNRLKEVGKTAVLADTISPIDSDWEASSDNG